jgi:hypothetical protein
MFDMSTNKEQNHHTSGITVSFFLLNVCILAKVRVLTRVDMLHHVRGDSYLE